MSKTIHHNQIRKPIVGFDAVFVVHDFIGFQKATNFLFYLQTMFKNIAMIIKRMVFRQNSDITLHHSAPVLSAIGASFRTIFGFFSAIWIAHKKLPTTTDTELIETWLAQSLHPSFGKKFFEPNASAQGGAKAGGFYAVGMHHKSFSTDDAMLSNFYQFWDFHKKSQFGSLIEV